MTLTEGQAVKALQTSDKLYAAFSQFTKLPYVTCNGTTFEDEVHIFATEEGVKRFGAELAEQKIAIFGACFVKKAFPNLYSILNSIDITTIVFHDRREVISVGLRKIVKPLDFSGTEPAKRPLLNPTLQLCGLYFAQEVRRPVPADQKTGLKDMEEELISNLKKSSFLVPVVVDKDNPKKLMTPCLKNKDGAFLLPVFTDVLEFAKFAGKNKVGSVKVPFAALPGRLTGQAKMMVVNPMGFNLIFRAENIEKIAKTDH